MINCYPARQNPIPQIPVPSSEYMPTCNPTKSIPGASIPRGAAGWRKYRFDSGPLRLGQPKSGSRLRQAQITRNWVYLEITETLQFGKQMLWQASYRKVHWWIVVGGIYGQGVQRGGGPARVQAASSSAWEWADSWQMFIGQEISLSLLPIRHLMEINQSLGS